MDGVLRDYWVTSNSERDVRVKVIAVGSLEEWQQQGFSSPGTGGVVYMEFHQVTEDVIRQVGPETVMSPVLARDFDCIELATHLHNLGFEGNYHAVAKNLPKPKLIEREVAQLCPRLNFKIELH